MTLPITSAPAFDVPDRIRTVADALSIIRALAPEVARAVEPGRSRARYTGRGRDQERTDPWCDTCHGRRFWRRLSGLENEAPRAYCPRCDGGVMALAASNAPLRVHQMQVTIEVELTLAYVERRLLDDAGKVSALSTFERGRPTELVVDSIERELAEQSHASAGGVVERRLIQVARLIRATLDDNEPVVRIPGRCPHCESRGLVMFPERGEISASMLPDPDTGRVSPVWVGGLLVCTFGECRCDDEECRCNRRDFVRSDGFMPYRNWLHSWSNDQWAWLSRVIEVDLFALAREGGA